MADPYEEDIRRLVNTIRSASRLLGRSPESLAEPAGLSAAEIHAIFDGSLKLEVHHIYRLAKALGVEPLDFFWLAARRPRQRQFTIQELEELMHKLIAIHGPGDSKDSGSTDFQFNWP